MVEYITLRKACIVLLSVTVRARELEGSLSQFHLPAIKMKTGILIVGEALLSQRLLRQFHGSCSKLTYH